MIARYLALAGLAACAVLATLYARQSVQLDRTTRALDHATAYIEATKEVDHATANLPDDPDDVLRELCRIAGTGGPGCGDP